MTKYKWEEVSIDKLVVAKWNYKSNNEELEGKLKQNLKENGVVQNLLIRPLKGGKYEVVNGNHRLKLLKELGEKKVMCCNLGDIPLAAAKKIAYETNETNFQADPFALSSLLKDLTDTFGLEKILATSPYDHDYINAMINTSKFDINEYTKHNGFKNDESPSSGASGGVVSINLSHGDLKRYNLMLEKLAGAVNKNVSGDKISSVMLSIALDLLENLEPDALKKAILEKEL